MDAVRSDEELAKRDRIDDREAGSLLFTRHERELIAYARHVCRNIFFIRDEEDLLQEAYLAGWLNRKKFRAPYKFAPWMKTIIYRTAYRWKQAEKLGPNIFGTSDGSEDINNMADEKNETPSDKLDREDFEDLLAELPKALADLDEPYQQISRLVLDCLRNDEQLPSSDDIAGATGISRRSVYRYRDTIYGRWKRLCEKRGFDSLFIAKILGQTDGN